LLAHEHTTPLAAPANFAHGIQSRVATEVTPLRNAEIGQAAAAQFVTLHGCAPPPRAGHSTTVLHSHPQARPPTGSTVALRDG
ncbi:hypothetical protein J8J20_24325, partial [Mycobacterium tuberculosis]|nr:hypothetical protein [Mycobacterium tuberculosis]